MARADLSSPRLKLLGRGIESDGRKQTHGSHIGELAKQFMDVQGFARSHAKSYQGRLVDILRFCRLVSSPKRAVVELLSPFQASVGHIYI